MSKNIFFLKLILTLVLGFTGLLMEVVTFGQAQLVWSEPVLGGVLHSGSLSNLLNAVLVKEHGAIYVAGVNATAKYDLDGNLIQSVSNSGGSMIFYSDGYIYVAGLGTVMKLDPNDLHEIWSQPDGACIDATAAVDTLGNLYFTTWRDGFRVIVKLASSDGHEIWSKTFPNSEYYWRMPTPVIDSRGNVYISDNLNILLLDARDSSTIWSQPTPVGSVFYFGLAVDSQDNLIVSGYNRDSVAITVKLASSDGNILWAQPLGGSVKVDSTGNIFVTGGWYTQKLDGSTGNALWPAPSPYGSWRSPLVIDNQGNIFVGTYSFMKLSGNDGSALWPQSIDNYYTDHNQIFLDSKGYLYINLWFNGSSTLAKYAQTGISELAPNTAWAVGTNVNLTVNGFGFSTGSTILWNGVPRATTFINASQLTSEIASSEITSVTDISMIEVMVTNLDGTITPPKVFTVNSANVGTSQNNVAVLGQSVAVYTDVVDANQTEVLSSVAAQAYNSGNSSPLAVTVATYANDPTAGAAFVATSQYVDVQVTGADANDIIDTAIYYTIPTTGTTLDNLELKYYLNGVPTTVVSSGGAAPGKSVVYYSYPNETSVASITFYVRFDNTSTPKITELSGTVFATVDKTKPAIIRTIGPSGPLAKGTATPITVEYTAPAGLPISIHWGDGQSSTTVSDGSGYLNINHTYSAAGVYVATIGLTDSTGESIWVKCEYIVIYDPSAGYVTGGGWITSPPGAYRSNSALSGKATFGFNAKYLKGASVPSGNTEFRLHFANFNFSSTQYEWLVVSGAKASYKGVGTINRNGQYGFMLSAIDGQVAGGGGIDKFRIKIWDLATDAIVYDNHYGASDTENPVTALGGGSVVIQK